MRSKDRPAMPAPDAKDEEKARAWLAEADAIAKLWDAAEAATRAETASGKTAPKEPASDAAGMREALLSLSDRLGRQAEERIDEAWEREDALAKWLGAAAADRPTLWAQTLKRWAGRKKVGQMRNADAMGRALALAALASGDAAARESIWVSAIQKDPKFWASKGGPVGGLVNRGGHHQLARLLASGMRVGGSRSALMRELGRAPCEADPTPEALRAFKRLAGSHRKKEPFGLFGDVMILTKGAEERWSLRFGEGLAAAGGLAAARPGWIAALSDAALFGAMASGAGGAEGAAEILSRVRRAQAKSAEAADALRQIASRAAWLGLDAEAIELWATEMPEMAAPPLSVWEGKMSNEKLTDAFAASLARHAKNGGGWAPLFLDGLGSGASNAKSASLWPEWSDLAWRKTVSHQRPGRVLAALAHLWREVEARTIAGSLEERPGSGAEKTEAEPHGAPEGRARRL
jgi:hypothetical protein